MKYFLCVFTIIVISLTPINSLDEVAPTPKALLGGKLKPIEMIPPWKPIYTGCNCPKDKVPLYRRYNPKTDDHFYTTNLNEANTAVITLGYKNEGIAGYVFPPTAMCGCNDGLVPVYRLFKKLFVKADHFYTTSVAEASHAAQSLQYKYEGVAFWCSSEPGDCGDCGVKFEFHRYNRHIDHFYTINLNEGFSNVLPYGGAYEGILCYIW